MGIGIGLILLGQPLSFVCTDGLRLNTIVFITELPCVEVYVLLEVLSAGEAAVKHLV